MGATTTQGTGPGAVQIVPLQIVENTITINNNSLDARVTALETFSNPDPVFLTDANAGETLGTTANLYFAALGNSDQTNVNLPDPTVMLGRILVFVGSFTDSESFLLVNGNMNGGNDTSYNITTSTIVRFISDGTFWWVG